MIKNRKTYIIIIFVTLLIFGSGGFYLIEGSDNWSIIDSIYMTVITLSTVGFGDFNPRSDFERMFVSFMLVFGVAIFSYIMGIFIEIL